MKVETELEGLLRENIQTTRTGNAIALASALGLDITEPVARERVLRNLCLVESQFKSDEDD